MIMLLLTNNKSQQQHILVNLSSVSVTFVNGTRLTQSIHCVNYILSQAEDGVYFLLMPAEKTQMLYCTVCLEHRVYI